VPLHGGFAVPVFTAPVFSFAALVNLEPQSNVDDFFDPLKKLLHIL